MSRRDTGNRRTRTVETCSPQTAPASAGRQSRGWRRWLRKLLLVAAGGGLAGALTLAILWVAFPYDFSRLDDYPAATRVLDREGKALRVYVSSTDEMRLPVALEEISPWLRLATVAVEDRRFYRHPGVDSLAIARAFLQNAVRLRVHSGASTITMQLVRMTEPRPRTLRAKAIEAFRALQITARRGKDETLEAYLNLAPYGGNVRGAEAAALRFFAKSARELTLGEAALLAGLPQSPSRLRPDRHYERALARRGTVLRAMLREGMIDDTQYREALASRPAVRRHSWPFEAPHAADLARREARRQPRGGGVAIATTLDREAQRSARSHLRAFLAERAEGRRRLAAAAVIIDVETAAVRALVGSTDFFDEERAGQVNAAMARRSPGSTLKPFLYALAFDLGVAGPSTFLADVPGAWPGYAPENFDRRFHGPVAAGEALARSLNLPALRLQSAVGGDAFLDLLRALGLRSLGRRTGHYGLTLALGGGEVRLLELAAAYATLVRGGLHRPWRLLCSQRRAADRDHRVLSEAASGLVLEALSRDEHLRRAAGRSLLPTEPRVGYKTGTSRGLRDAWALAFTPRRVVAVWIGDPRGSSHPDLIGLDAAAPVALSILEEDGRDDPRRWTEPEGIVELPVCAATGFPRGNACPSVLPGRFTPAGASRLPSCTVHRRVIVDSRTGRRLCSSCGPHLPEGSACREVLVEDWPPPVARWLARRRRLRAPPPHAPGCGTVSGAPPRIVSPPDGAEYGWIEGAPSAQEVTLAAATSGGASRLHWFVDGELVRSAAPEARIAWPLEPGRHEVRCVDDRGRAASATIRCARLR